MNRFASFVACDALKDCMFYQDERSKDSISSLYPSEIRDIVDAADRLSEVAEEVLEKKKEKQSAN